MNPKERNYAQPKKIALVCSGGATKAAAFHMGVCLALQEKGFVFKGGLKSSTNKAKSASENEIATYVGSSAGSFICTYLAAGYSVQDIFNAYLQKAGSESRLKAISYATLMSLRGSSHEEKTSLLGRMKGVTDYALNVMNKRTLITVPGLFTTAGIESHVRDVLPSNNFSDYSSALFIVATQLNHSKRVIFSKEKRPSPKDDPSCIYATSATISDAVAASTALPPIFSPYAIRNSKGKVIYYFDGEIRETLSVHVAEDADADLIISSYTHVPYHYSREIGSLTKFGITAIGIQAIYLLIERKIQLAIYNRDQKQITLNAVHQYCIDNGLADTHRRKICEIIEEKLAHRPNVRYIYIHPRPSDHQMFFGEHFSLKPKFMESIVQIGFRAGISALMKYNFSNR
jgi:predicted acylesterase/phospholipase RssA